MLTDIIDSYLQSKAQEQEAPTDKFRVSDAGRCKLMRYWKRKGVEPTNPPEARVMRVFEVGNIFHRWLQNILKEQGSLIHEEYEVEDEHRRGHIDAVVETPAGRYLMDFKTVHSRKFNYLTTDVDNHYLYQIITYYLMYPDNIDELFLVYVSKDDLRIREVAIKATMPFDTLIYMVKRDWEELIEHWEKDKEPEPIPYHKWECAYCIYQARCESEFKKDEEEKVVPFSSNYLEGLLAKREELLEYVEEYSKVDKEIREYIKSLPLGKIKVGNYYIEKSLINRKTYNIPEEIKEQYLEVIPHERIYIKSVEDI